MDAETIVSLTPEIEQAVHSLGENLSYAEPIVSYRMAAERLNGDAQARALLQELSEAQAAIRQRQVKGQVRQEDIDHLRAIQDQVRSNPVIMDYAQAQQVAITFLREVNMEISQLLGFDYGSLAGRTTC